MHCLGASSLLLLGMFVCFSLPADAQINLKTGYNFSVLSNPGLDHVIELHNDLKGFDQPYQSLKWMHGFETGVRFKSEVHALEVSYQGVYRSLKASGQIGDQPFTDKLRFAIHALALGYQASQGIFGLGTDFQYQFYKVKRTSTQDGDFKNIQGIPALKFYVMFTLRGSKGVDMALQPYYVLPLKDYDLNPLNAALMEVGPAAQEKWDRFGLSILFYNGSK